MIKNLILYNRYAIVYLRDLKFQQTYLCVPAIKINLRGLTPRLIITCLYGFAILYLRGQAPRRTGRRDWIRTNDPHHVKVML